jgi:hypothetical protein
MPTYVYKNCKTGKSVEVFMPICEMQRRQRPDGTITLDDGTLAQRDWSPDNSAKTRSRGWPIESYAAAVHPDQVPETQKMLRDKGVKCGFTSEGLAVFESPGHRKKVCRAMGLRDNNGGYSDP